MKISTEQHYPNQWTAIDSSTYDGAPDAGAMATMGRGSTERAAIDDLLQQFEDGKPWQQQAAREWRVANDVKLAVRVQLDAAKDDLHRAELSARKGHPSMQWGQSGKTLWQIIDEYRASVERWERALASVSAP